MTFDILHTLDTDPEARGAFIEALRAASAELTGTTLVRLDFGTKRMVRHDLAGQLLRVARGLCDHARVDSLGCVYCGAEVDDG